MTRPMARRRFLGIAAASGFGAAIAFRLPGALAADRVRRIGVFEHDDGSWGREVIPMLLAELKPLGFERERNLSVEVGHADDLPDRLAVVAQELVRSGVELIFTENTQNTRVLQRVTRSTPIVTAVGDPVGSGFASSLARPGGNITGLSYGTTENAAKTVELVQLTWPGIRSFVMMEDATDSAYREIAAPMLKTARERGIEPRLVARQGLGVEAAERELRTMKQRGEKVAYIRQSEQYERLAETATRLGIALVSNEKVPVQAGALFSFAAYHRQPRRRQAAQVAAILRGANPAQLPFESPDATEVHVNRRTASQLGIAIPPQLLILANEVVG